MTKKTRILSLNSDFSVTGAGDEKGGTVSLTPQTAAPTSVQRLKITRIVDILQLTDLRNQGKFYAEIHEDAFDLLKMCSATRDWHRIVSQSGRGRSNAFLLRKAERISCLGSIRTATR